MVSYQFFGNNVTIFHHVTIGVNDSKPDEDKRIVIKDNCYLSTRSVIISCVIGESCIIAPYAVVYTDVPLGMLCYANNERKKIIAVR